MYRGKFRNTDNAPVSREPELEEDILDQEYFQEDYETDPPRDYAETEDYPPEEPEPMDRKARKAAKKAAKAEKKARRKRSVLGRLITVVFYVLFFAAVGVSVFKIWSLRGQVEEQLVIYEDSQPHYRSQEIFDSLFADPDWAALYDLVGIEDTRFEGKEAFVSYMKEKVGDSPLVCRETVTEEPHTRLFAVLLEDAPIASFTMVNKAPDSEIPQWEQGRVELFFNRNLRYTIVMAQGHTATVNGVPLEEADVVQIGTMKAGEYAPEGFEIPKTCYLEAGPFLMLPQVAITDESGAPVEVTYNEATGTFLEASAAQIPSDEQRERAFDALKTYCLFMAHKVGDVQLSEHFKRGTSTFDYISRSELVWVQKDSGHSFADEEVTGYLAFDENHYAIRLHMVFQLKRPDGTLKESDIDETLFFEKQGDWKVTRMTAVDIFEPYTEVRLTFRNGEEEIASKFYDASVSELICPAVTAPSGQSFAGWMYETTAEDGSAMMQRVFLPDENGLVKLPAGTPLKPMTLYPVFE